MTDSYGSRSTIEVSGREYEIHRPRRSSPASTSPGFPTR